MLLMNIARNASGQAAHFRECLGQHLIASYVSLFDFRVKVCSCDILESKEIILKEIDQHRVKVVGFYIGADTVVMIGNLIRWLKKIRKVVVIVGGPEAYALDEKFLNDTGCDCGVYGEGEVPVLSLLRWAVDGIGSRSQIKSLKYLDEKGIYHVTPPEEPIKDLDSIPFPQWENSLNKRFRMGESMGILTGRGCPYHCSFCFEGAVSKTVRQRSMENVIQEIEEVRRKNPFLRCVNVYDDTFTLNRERVLQFCSYMREQGLLWSCEGHVSRLCEYPEVIKTMVDSGLIAMQIGIESGSRKVLRAYHKGTTPEMIETVVKECKGAGLLTLEGNYIVGGAFEDWDTVEESIAHAKRLLEVGRGMLELSTVFFSPYFGTPITKNPRKFGMRIEDNEKHTVISMRDAVVSTQALSAEDIVKAKERFDNELRKKYYEEAVRCTKKDVLSGTSRSNRKMRINQNWCGAWNQYSFIKEFAQHRNAAEQTFDSDKYPIRTIGAYFLKENSFFAQGIRLEGIEKDAVLYADGRKKAGEIADILNLSISQIKEVYEGLNERCLVYFSEF